MIAVVGAKVVGAPTDSYLAYREKVTAEVGAARIGDQADLDKKYTVEVSVRLVKVVGPVKVKGFSARAESHAQSVLADDGLTPGPDGRYFKSDDGRSIRLLRVPLLKTWAKTADAGIKSTNDVAVIFDREAFYTDVFADAAAYRFGELPVKRKPVDALAKALLLGESQDGAPEGSNTLVGGACRRNWWLRGSGRGVVRNVYLRRWAIIGSCPRHKQLRIM